MKMSCECSSRSKLSVAVSSIAVNCAPMAHCHDEHDQPLLLQFADDAIVAHPIAPEPKLAASKRFSKAPRVFGQRDSVIHVIEDFPLDGAIEFPEVSGSPRVVFNLNPS
jgi:hypothetical protein